MLPVAKRRPSGENATLDTPDVWPRSVKTSWPVSVSHSFTVRSKLAEAIRRPSGLKVTEATVHVWPDRVSTRRPVVASKTLTSPGTRSPG